MRSPLIEIRNETRRKAPRVPFERIARRILPERYELSLVICEDALARKMNRAYRKRTYAANVLAFPLTAREGEIFLNTAAAAREAKAFGVSLRARLALLFVHACLHLKGYRHGKRMDTLERKILNTYS
jgi:probable rRNA maturation factor